MTRAGRVLAAALLLALPRAAAAATLEYLYVESNAGGSSGGHVALRIDDVVFDFQHGDHHTLRLRRSSYDEFRYGNSVLGNRTIHAARIDAPEPVAARLGDRFNARYLVSRRQFAVLDALDGDRRLLAALARRGGAGGGDTTALLPAGRVVFARTPGAAPRSEALAALRDRVARERGDDFLAGRIRAFEAQLLALRPSDRDALPRVSWDELPDADYAFCERYRDAVLWLMALHALADALPVRDEALLVPEPDGTPLDPREREALARLAEELGASLVELAASSRPDGGLALGTGLARLEALHASLRSGQLRLVDPFLPDAAPGAAGAADAAADADPYLLEMQGWAAERYAAARARLAEPTALREADLRDLELAAGRLREIRRAVATGAPLGRLAGGRRPAPWAAGVALPLPALSTAELAEAGARARAREDRYVDELRDVFAYELVTRNCVTELFDTIDAELGAGGSALALGGHLDTGPSLRVIPFVSFDRVVDSYRVEQVRELPSYRRRRLAEMYARENDVLVFLRESNTLSSTLYRRGAGDSFFLFFSEDAAPLRPLFGALNLASAVAASALGLVSAPFDRGHLLWSGVQGAVYSLPELAFVSIRKGNLRYAPDALAALDDESPSGR